MFSLCFVNLAVLVFYTCVPFIVLDCSLEEKNKTKTLASLTGKETRMVPGRTLYLHTQDPALGDLHHRTLACVLASALFPT